MIFDSILIGVFFVSSITLWYRLSQRIPELVAVPDEVVHAYIHEEISRRRSMVVSLIRAWYHDKSYREVFLHFCGKLLYKFHIILLKADNAVVGILKKVRVNGFAAAASNGVNGGGSPERSETYWKDLRGNADVSTSPSTSAPRSTRIEGVRFKKNNE